MRSRAISYPPPHLGVKHFIRLRAIAIPSHRQQQSIAAANIRDLSSLESHLEGIIAKPTYLFITRAAS